MFIICLIVFAATVPVSIILPMLPYIGTSYGATPFQVSLLFALMPAITIFVSPFWGKLSDRLGRKPVFLGTLGASAIAFLMFALADSLPGMFFARAVQGLTNGSIGIAFAMVSDSSDFTNRAKSIGYVSAAMALSFFVGPVLGALFMGSDPATFDHAPPCYFAAALCAAATLAGFKFLHETRKPRHLTPGGATWQPSERPAAVFTQATLVLIIVMFLIGGCTSSTNQFAFTFWAQGAHGWGPNMVSYGLASIGGGYLLATLGLIGPLTRRYGDEGTFLIGAIIDLSGLLIFFLVRDNVWLGVGAIILSIIGGGTWNTVLSSVLSKQSPPDKMGMMLGLSNGANMVGRVVGPLVGGLLLPTSLAAPFVANLAITVLVILGALRVVWLVRRNTQSIAA